jgi:endonuclease G
MRDVQASEEAVILGNERPSLLIQNDAIAASKFEISPAALVAIRSVGLLLLNGRALGTGWMIKENILVTNRHVASHFVQAIAGPKKYVLKANVTVTVDFYREHNNANTDLFEVSLMIYF